MLANSNRHNIYGDTLVEALFAITIFSLVAVGSMSVMNQASATAQRALEITLVRQEIDAQAETLRFLNASYIANYSSSIVNNCTTPSSRWMAIGCRSIANISTFNTSSSCSIPSGSFILNSRKATLSSISPSLAQTFSQVRYNAAADVSSSEGIWIQAIRPTITGSNEDNSGYVDFHIRACWDSPGQSIPVSIGTIVRLYEPRQ